MSRGKQLQKKSADIARASFSSSHKQLTRQPPIESQIETHPEQPLQVSSEKQALLDTMKNTSFDFKSLSLELPVSKSPVSVQMQKDGSGKHGTEPATWTDQGNKQLWYGAADAAEGMGMTNAARHMRHYLYNSGATLSINPGFMERDVPSFTRQVAQEIEVAKNDANQKIAVDYTGSPIKFSLNGSKKGGYARKSESQDWFFAVGGFTYWYTAEVTVKPSPKSRDSKDEKTPPPQVEMKFTMHVYDRYNWDEGKSVTIAGVVISDTTLGRLHKAGIAQEYNVEGQSSPRHLNWTYSPPVNSNESDSGGGARPGRGGRVDPRRHRGRR